MIRTTWSGGLLTIIMESRNQYSHIIEVKLLAGLKKYNPESSKIIIEGNETVSDIVHYLDINSELVRTAFLDGRFVPFNTKVAGASKLLLLPAIGGG